MCNSHFTGSPLWDLFSRESEMFYNTWNKSVRLMFDLSLRTHRYFLEPLAGRKHLKTILTKRFLSFIQQIENSHKILPNLLLQTIKNDCRSSTGSNLRNILLLTDKEDVSKLAPHDANQILFEQVDDNDEWKVDMLLELIDVRWNEAKIEHFSDYEIEEMIEHICTS